MTDRLHLLCHVALRIVGGLLLVHTMLSSHAASPPPAPTPPGQSRVFDIRTFGADGSDSGSDTTAIQAAIDAAHAAGGGSVRVPAGTYTTGSLFLLSGVTLHLEAEATIRGSADLADYRRSHWPALIIARDQERIAITGEGTLDGNSHALAAEFERIRASGNALTFFPHSTPGIPIDIIGPTGVPTRFDPHALHAEGRLMAYVYGSFTRPYEFVRPQILEFWGCRNVTVSGITLRNAACWVQTYRDCEDVLIEKVRVRSTHYWNNDGIDLVDCRRVKVLDCDIDSADDALCLKSDPRGAGCADIEIARCTLRSRASALKFGTASHHGFRRIRASDLTVADTYRSVVALQSVDGATLEDVTIERVRATNTGNAFALRLGHRTASKPPGVLRRVTLRDFDVEIPPLPDNHKGEEGRPHNLLPASIVGIPGHPITDITIEDMRIHYGGGGRREVAEVPLDQLDALPEKERGYPEFSMWGELPAWGIYLRHTQGVTFRNTHLSLSAPDFRPAIVTDRSERLSFDRLRIGSGGATPAVVLHRSPGASVARANIPAGNGRAIAVLPADH